MKANFLSKIFSLIDLTSLNETDSEVEIISLCNQAVGAFGHVAGVCVYPRFVKQVSGQLADHPIKIVAVANFPQGNNALDAVVASIRTSIYSGANEIDVVFPYTDYLAGKIDAACDFIKKCKAICGEEILLKVILETGALKNSAIIKNMSRDVLLSGADFLKTSTGKIATGATLPAARIILMTIKEMVGELKRPIGFKASGGIRTIEMMESYLDLAVEIMGPHWATRDTFRFGVSRLFPAFLPG